MEMRQAALDSVKIAAAELLKQAGSDQDDAVRGLYSINMSIHIISLVISRLSTLFHNNKENISHQTI
jgi:hypothetical protein